MSYVTSLNYANDSGKAKWFIFRMIINFEKWQN